MKTKMNIKRRDLNAEQIEQFCNSQEACKKCRFGENMEDCLQSKVKQNALPEQLLNQEVTIEVHDILTQKEHDYLEGIIRPFKDKVKKIIKMPECICSAEMILIEIYSIIFKEIKNTTIIYLPPFREGTMYRGMILRKPYTTEELGL